MIKFHIWLPQDRSFLLHLKTQCQYCTGYCPIGFLFLECGCWSSNFITFILNFCQNIELILIRWKYFFLHIKKKGLEITDSTKSSLQFWHKRCLNRRHMGTFYWTRSALGSQGALWTDWANSLNYQRSEAGSIMCQSLSRNPYKIGKFHK